MEGPRNATGLDPRHPLRDNDTDRRDLPIPVVSYHLPEGHEDADLSTSPKEVMVHADHFVKWDAIYAPSVFQLAKERKCALCGKRFTVAAFVGGPSTVINGRYNDGPMHLECAIAALTLCPHLRLGAHRRSAESRAEGLPERSEQIFLTIASGYSIELGDGHMNFIVAFQHVIAVKAHKYVDGEIEEDLAWPTS